MAKVGITGRHQNEVALKTAQRALETLTQNGAQVEVDRKFLPRAKAHKKKLRQFDCDIILSFGGDGTLLEAYRETGGKIPIMGINCGNLGFLQSYQKEEVEKAAYDALSGNYEVEKRSRINAKVDGKIAGVALNEVLVVPQKAGRLMRYKLKISSNERAEAGDGLIVATPTGSTAHALSAGGPIVKGNAAVFVVVSVNPVDWKHRPLIINDHETVLLHGFEKLRCAEAIIDGQLRFMARKKVELSKGHDVLFVKRKN